MLWRRSMSGESIGPTTMTVIDCAAAHKSKQVPIESIILTNLTDFRFPKHASPSGADGTEQLIEKTLFAED